MTETHTTIAPGVPNFPAGRYGRRREARRRRPWLVGLVVVVIVAAMAGIAAKLYRQYGDPNYDAQVITYTDVTDKQMRVDFTVTMPAGGTAICTVRARTHDGAEVGHENVTVTAPAGETIVTVSHTLATTARAWIGDITQCQPAR